VIAALAEAQDGMVARWQLLGDVVSPEALRHRRRTEQLLPVHEGVYRLAGIEFTPRRRAIAARLACGMAAVWSHETAAFAWKRRSLLPARTDITTAVGQPRSTASYLVHRVPSLDARDVRIAGGVPVTSPARTLLDRAGGQAAGQVEREYDELRIARLVAPYEVIEAIERAPHRRGAALLRELVELEIDPVDLREEGERRLRDLLMAGAVKTPEYNANVLGHAFDVVWRDEMLIVEFDGYGVHSRRRKFERDRDKANQVQHRGWLVDRVTWTELTRFPARVLARIAAALATRAGFAAAGAPRIVASATV
jgi:very-short-patch-repair endonuclease